MNLLVEELPIAVEIDGREYPIYTDFRHCLLAIIAFEDTTLTNFERRAILLANLYPKLPHDTVQAIQMAVKFLDGGKSSDSGEEGGSGPRVYSFSKDSDLIFSAFMQTHNIDLVDTEYLHWWKFLALFSDLGSETAFCNLVALRKRVKTGKASKEERQAAHEMGDRFDVPELDMRTLEEREKEAEFLNLFRGRHKRRPPDTEYPIGE